MDASNNGQAGPEPHAIELLSKVSLLAERIRGGQVVGKMQFSYFGVSSSWAPVLFTLLCTPGPTHKYEA